jgi:hypothetical protein
MIFATVLSELPDEQRKRGGVSAVPGVPVTVSAQSHDTMTLDVRKRDVIEGGASARHFKWAMSSMSRAGTHIFHVTCPIGLDGPSSAVRASEVIPKSCVEINNAPIFLFLPPPRLLRSPAVV